MSILLRIAAVFLMMGVGAVARSRRLLDAESTTRLSRLVVVLFYPSLIYATLVSTFTFRTLLRHWPLPAGALLIMSVGFLVGLAGSRLLGFSSDRERRTFHFQCAINNYSFLPLPILLLLAGDRGAADLIFSTVGSEIAVWTLGMIALTGAGLHRSSLRHLLTPPMLAILGAIGTLAVAEFAGIGLPPQERSGEFWNAIVSALDMFGKATIPLAMLVAGSRMNELRPRHLLSIPLAAGVVLRTVLIPATAALLVFVLPFSDSDREVLLVLAVMPCSLASVMLSDAYGGDSDFAAASVLATHMTALATIPLWLRLLLPSAA
ncbi:MAG: hypothetical protein GXP31_15240 [Kiritimatiellaeota bacterium]|nr:hypothetical protein [Kiritimatiellota bacterium]